MVAANDKAQGAQDAHMPPHTRADTYPQVHQPCQRGNVRDPHVPEREDHQLRQPCQRRHVIDAHARPHVERPQASEILSRRAERGKKEKIACQSLGRFAEATVYGNSKTSDEMQ